MNAKMIRYMIGKMLGVEALVLLIPTLVALYYQEAVAKSFLLTAFVLFCAYVILGRTRPKDSNIYSKEGLFVVALAWVLWSAFGALPFFLSGITSHYIDALFEMVSGFTTTGATIISNVNELPHAINFWRAFSQWIGGMGVLVFAMMLTSLGEKSSMVLVRAEVTGVDKNKLLPKARQSSLILYIMYWGLTLVVFICLLLGGMSPFDSVIHALSTAATGGASNYVEGVAHFNSAYIEGVMSVFMILFGINFNVYFLLFFGERKSIFKNEELKVYLLMVATSVVVVTISLLSTIGEPLKAFRDASFQVASMISTTGAVSTNYNAWSEFAKIILLFLMIVGACASSTGGGIKVSRMMILFKNIKNEIKQMLHPKSINLLKVNGERVSNQAMKSIYTFLGAYLAILVCSVLIISLDNFNFETTTTAVLSALSNIGPGFGSIGPAGNYAGFSFLSKIVLCLNMLVGRLEIFSFLILFTPLMRTRKF